MPRGHGHGGFGRGLAVLILEDLPVLSLEDSRVVY